MNNYRGQIRRQADHTPTKSSWENDKNNFQQIQQQKYSRNKDYQKSQLSYYQSQASHSIYDNEAPRQSKMLQKNRSTSTMNVNSNNTNENKELYDNLIPIKVQSADSEEYSSYLRVQIINTVEKGMNKLTLYLTDDKDPKFLWLFIIKENDFMMLKKQQKLRVDFRGFPSMLMDHFDMCKSQKQAANSLNMNECYFFSLFEMKKNEGSLNIVQANKYKQSVHLSLKCKLGNDEQIKEYLSEKLLKSENQNMNLRNTISNLQQALSLRKQQIVKIEIDLKQQRKLNEKSSEQFQIEFNRLETELKKSKIESEQKIKKQLQKEYKQMKQSLQQQLNRYIKSYDEVKQKYQNLQQKTTGLQSKQRQLNFDVSTKSKEVESYTKRLDQIKSYTLELQNKRSEDQKVIIQQKVRIQSLQSQINDKLKIIQSNSELKSTNSHQISSLQVKNEEYKKQIQKLQTKIESLQNQLTKYQNGLEHYREKYEKKKSSHQDNVYVIKEQQKCINKKDGQIIELKKLVQNKEKLIDDLKMESNQKDRKVHELKRQIDECQKKIKQDNDLITHLQKQLNQRTIGLRPGITGGLSYQRSTSPFSSNVSNRDFINTNTSLGNTSTSRLKFTSSNENNNEETEFRSNPRKDLQIKKYVPNEDRERSKSPISNSRLNQQKEPEDMKNTSMIKPVKFKFSQKQ